MSNRTTRIAELIQREVNDVLRTRFQQQAVTITLTGADVAPDLRNANLYYAVIGGEGEVEKAARFFDRFGGAIRHEIARRIILKYIPALRFVHDTSPERAQRIQSLLGEPEAPMPGAEEDGDAIDDADPQ